MDYKIIAKVFESLSDENSIRLLMLLREHEKTADELADQAGLSSESIAAILLRLKKAGLIIAVKNDSDRQDYYGISPFGSFGAVNMLKEILNVESGCSGCGKN